MKYFKIKLIALCGLMVLAAASLAPVMADESACPQWEVSCTKNLCYCDGTLKDGYCYYDRACMNGGCCNNLID